MSILVGIFYGVISGSMSLINKVVLNTFGFPFPNVLMLVQTMVTALALEIFRWQKWVDIPRYSLERGKLLLIPSVCYAVHMLLVLLALSRLSLPMYNVLRRLTPLVTLFLSCVILKKRPSALITLAVITIVTGCIITGLDDLSGSAATYVIAIASCFLQAAYLTYVQKTGLDAELSALSIVHINCINCLPFLFLYTLIQSELQGALKFSFITNLQFQVVFLSAVLMGFLLNYSMFLCATKNSALSVSLIGILKSTVTTVIGFFSFGGAPITVLTVSGIVLNTLGSLMYILVRHHEKQKISSEQDISLKKSLDIKSSEQQDGSL